MKKYLLLTTFLSFALLSFAQDSLKELSFYQNKAQSATKQTQQEIINNLETWLDKNPFLPEASKAVLLKANLEKNLKDTPAFIITLLRYKYEFGPSSKTNIQSVLQDTQKDLSKSEQETYEKLINKQVPLAVLAQRLDTFLTLATKANLKDTYEPLKKEYNSFFKRFGNYEDIDRLELMLGDLHRANKNPYPALMQYEKVWEVYDNTKYKAASLRMQGDIYASELKDYERARDIYEKVLNDFPNSVERPTAYYHLAIMEDTQKLYNEALSHSDFAANLYKEQGDKQNFYEVLMFKEYLQEKRLKDYEGAVKTLKQLAPLYRTDEEKFEEIQFKLADLYKDKIKDVNLQRKAYADFLRAYPNAKQADKATMEVAALAKKAGEYETAKNYLERLIVNNPSSPYAPKAQREVNSLNKKIAKNY